MAIFTRREDGRILLEHGNDSFSKAFGSKRGMIPGEDAADFFGDPEWRKIRESGLNASDETATAEWMESFESGGARIDFLISATPAC